MDYLNSMPFDIQEYIYKLYFKSYVLIEIQQLPYKIHFSKVLNEIIFNRCLSYMMDCWEKSNLRYDN